jgi:hypothetical protein
MGFLIGSGDLLLLHVLAGIFAAVWHHRAGDSGRHGLVGSSMQQEHPVAGIRRRIRAASQILRATSLSAARINPFNAQIFGENPRAQRYAASNRQV